MYSADHFHQFLLPSRISQGPWGPLQAVEVYAGKEGWRFYSNVMLPSHLIIRIRSCCLVCFQIFKWWTGEGKEWGWGRPRLRVVRHFSSGLAKRAKRERAWKSPHARKGDTRRGERKMRDYRQSPSICFCFFGCRLIDFILKPALLNKQ